MAVAEEQIVKPYYQTDRFSLYEGDSRSVLPILLCRLQQSVSFAMARMAERYQVVQIVSHYIVTAEEAIWADVVNVITGLKAVLTSVAIAPSRLAFLRLPVWATITRRPAEILRMQNANALNVTAGARTELSLSGVVHSVTWGALIVTPATDTAQFNLLSKLSSDRFVLAFTRARLTPSMLKTRLRNMEGRAARLAGSDRFHAPIIDHEKVVVYV